MHIATSKSARRALFMLFLLPGLSLATWITRTPALRDGLQASTEQMGMVLFGFSVGAMGGILSAARLASRFGARRITLLSLLLLVSGLGVLAASIALDSMACAFGGLVLFGTGLGWVDIVVNIEGAFVERHTGQPLMATLHGFFSLGTLVGALAGMIMTALQVPLYLHLCTIAGLSIPLILLLVGRAPWISDQQTSNSHQSSAEGSNWTTLLRDRPLLMICFVVLAMALAEGAANDWLPLLMIDGHGFAEATGTLIYLVFTLGMTLGRFAGGRMVERLGRTRLLRGSALLGSLSLSVIVFCDTPWIAAIAVVMWGLGASLGFPLAISAAGESGPDGQQRVRLAAISGYLAFLVGPPLLGFIGEVYGLRLAMVPVLSLVAIAFVAASALDERKRQTLLRTS